MRENAHLIPGELGSEGHLSLNAPMGDDGGSSFQDALDGADDHWYLTNDRPEEEVEADPDAGWLF